MSKAALMLLLPGFALAIWSTDSVNVGHWYCRILNDGSWGNNRDGGFPAPGACWPFPLRNHYVYGAGPWFGRIIGRDTLVSAAYDQNTTNSEFGPTLNRYWRQGRGVNADRIYDHPGDWPPPRSRFPMAPQNWRADQDQWCCFGDSEPALHFPPPAEQRSVGVDVALTVCAFSDEPASDFFLLRYDVMNDGNDPLESLLVGMMVDADVGDPRDDMVGLILDKPFVVQGETVHVRNTGFGYDYDNTESDTTTWEAGTPGTVAVSLLAAPDGQGFSAFKLLSLESEPWSDAERYRVLAGCDFQNGTYAPLDSIDTLPGDKHFVAAVGPLEIPAHGHAEFWYAVIGSPFGAPGEVGPKSDTNELAVRYRVARDRYFWLVGVPEPVAQATSPFRVNSSLFSSAVPLRVQMPDGASRLEACDVAGRIVRRFAGRVEIVWNGTDAAGRMLPAGAYFLRCPDRCNPAMKVILVEP